MTPITDQDADQIGQKPRRPGGLPPKPDSLLPETLRRFVTLAAGSEPWTLYAIDRTGVEDQHSCTLVFRNGRDTRELYFRQQRELRTNFRAAIVGRAPDFQAPHLTPIEAEDVWVSLCQLGRAIEENAHRAEAESWLETMLPYTQPLREFSLVPDRRRDGLMALYGVSQFLRPDAAALLKSSDDARLKRPLRFIDEHTEEVFLRVGETAVFLRWFLGVEPLGYPDLYARMKEIGVVRKDFQNWEPPHPKARMFLLTVAQAEGLK